MAKFKPIAGYEGLYEISDDGQVRSFHVHRGAIGSRILKPQQCVNGYHRVELCNKRGKKKHSIHRLVALAFISNPDNHPQVNHKDGNKDNNNLSNLEWVTCQENIIHARRLGLNNNSGRPKRGVIATEIKTGKKIHFESLSKAGECGFKLPSIIRCCKAHRTTHSGYEWQYA